MSEHWNPCLYFRNYVGNQQKEVTLTYELNFKENEAYVIEQRQLSGTFSEKLELEEFPFDIQVSCSLKCKMFIPFNAEYVR